MTPRSSSRWFLVALVSTVLALGLGAGQGLAAKELSREERLKLHREKVQRILEERRRQREAQTRSTATRAPSATRRRTSAQPAQPSPVSPSQTVIYLQPLNVFTQVGWSFVTRVIVDNAAGQSFDQVEISAGFDPHLLRPKCVSDHTLRHKLAAPPEFEVDVEAGWIWYSAKLAQPIAPLELELLSIEWEALTPSDHTKIILSDASGSGASTGLALGERDVLGDPDNPQDGTISAEVTIRPADEAPSRGGRLITDRESLRIYQGINPTGQVALMLVPAANRIVVGDTLPVDVVVLNPASTRADDLRFAIRFDPKVFEVLDADRDNWISAGTNILDGPFHQAFPFDFHICNRALNDTGLIEYHMGFSSARVLPSGNTVARIYLRALSPAAATPLKFIFSEDPSMPGTAVECFGADVLGALDNPTDGTRDLVLTVTRADRR